jgi:MFS family permease
MGKFGRTLLYVDLLITSSFGLLLPFLAVVITERISGATMLQVGYAVAVYVAAKAAAQLVLSRYGDEDTSVRLRLKLLVAGGVLLTLVPLGYLLVGSIAMLLVVQALWGLGEALVSPAWYSLFNQSLPETHESRSWKWRETVGLILAGLAAIAGGWLVSQSNYHLLFIGMALLAGIACFFSIRLYRGEEGGRRLAVRGLRIDGNQSLLDG